MPIQPPSLDDRRYQDLVDDLLALIPAHAPEWTNPVPGDPGRSLLELFAWLTDTLLYRVNLIPERQRRAFLRLLNIPLRPAAAAQSLIAVQFANPASKSAFPLPPKTPVPGPVPFETLGELTVLPVLAEAYCKRPPTDRERTELQSKIDQLTRFYPTVAAPVPYITTPLFPSGRPLPDGFDLARDSVDHCLWFALLSPVEGLDSYGDELDALAAALGRSPSGTPNYLNLGLAPSLLTPTFGDNAAPLPPVPFACEVTTPKPGDPKGVAYQPLTIVADSTRGLRTNGVVRLALPDAPVFFAPKNNVRDDRDAGTGDKPPRLDDPGRSQRLLAWIRLRPTVDITALSIAWAGVNAVQIDQRKTEERIVFGHSSGQPDQEIALPYRNIEESSFALDVEEPGLGFVRWRKIDDLALDVSQAPVFTFDPEAGTVRFGDGVRGRIPVPGARFRAATLRAGGGAAGNVPAGTLAKVLPKSPNPPLLKALQPFAAVGGEDPESVADAERRIPALLRHRDRAVTGDDFARIAAATPGAHVARVEVLPRFKPQERRPDVPGVVSVMVWPSRPTFDPPYPRVDRPFIEAVFSQLEPRRTLGTELYVIGCEYVPLALSVGIENPGGSDEVNRAVQSALKQYLFCLPPGGPNSQGWPLGRSVKRRELEVVVSRVTGVAGVFGPNLFTKVGNNWQRVLTPDGGESAQIAIAAWQLPELVGVIVASGPAPTEFKPPAPTKANDGLAIPVVPEVC